jgi:hypothetical protein
MTIGTFSITVDDNQESFNLDEIYEVDFSTQETIIESAIKINGYYGLFLSLLPQIVKKKNLLDGSIDDLEHNFKVAKNKAFIYAKSGIPKPTDALAKAQSETVEEVLEIKQEISTHNKNLAEIGEQIGIISGIIKTLTCIEDQLTKFSYFRRIALREEQKLAVADEFAKRG